MTSAWCLMLLIVKHAFPRLFHGTFWLLVSCRMSECVRSFMPHLDSSSIRTQINFLSVKGLQAPGTMRKVWCQRHDKVA
jgi:hypothetical protein